MLYNIILYSVLHFSFTRGQSRVIKTMQSLDLHTSGDQKKPLLIVFDLDLTLWPFRVDKSTTSPFHLSRKGNVTDAKGKVLKTFPSVSEVLKELLDNKYVLAIASRIEDIAGVYQLLHLFEITHYFAYKEIYPGSKTSHFQKLRAKSGVDYSDMLFFDDDKRNVRDVSRLGVTVLQVPDSGITSAVVKSGLSLFASQHV